MAAYNITDVRILEPENVRRYSEIADASIRAHGGRFLVRGATPTVAEGEWPPHRHLVIVEFPSMDQLRQWYDSTDYASARAIAATALDRAVYFVDGVEALD